MNGKEDYVPQAFFGQSPCLGPVGCTPIITQFPVVPPPDFVVGVFGYNHKDSYAAYLGADHKITPKLTVSVFGRYSYEKQHVGTSSYLPRWCRPWAQSPCRPPRAVPLLQVHPERLDPLVRSPTGRMFFQLFPELQSSLSAQPTP